MTKNSKINKRAILDQVEKESKELKALLKQKMERMVLRSIDYYVVRRDPGGQLTPSPPHKHQDDFHRDKSNIRVIRAAKRSGKSEAGIREDVAHMMGYRAWLPKDDPDYWVLDGFGEKIRIPNRGLIASETFDEQIKKVILRKLLGDKEHGIPGAIPADELKGVRRNQKGVINEITLINGSVCYLNSYMQDPDLYESDNTDWAHFDELPPRPIWKKVRRGHTDNLGKVWVTSTLDKEPWFYDEVLSRPDVAQFQFDIWANVGYGLTIQGVEQYAKDLTEQEKRVCLHGEYFLLDGMIFKSYGNVHRINRTKIPKHWNIWMHIDTHPREPHNAIWLAILPDNKRFVVGELINGDPNNSVKPFAEAVKVYEHEVLGVDSNKVDRLIEPGSQVHNPGGPTIRKQFETYGIRCKLGTKKSLDARILLMQKELEFNPELGVYPNIFFFNDLPIVHKEMMSYIWDDWSRRTGYLRTEKQKPRDKDDHMIEGLLRILYKRPKYFDLNKVHSYRPSANYGKSPNKTAWMGH